MKTRKTYLLNYLDYSPMSAAITEYERKHFLNVKPEERHEHFMLPQEQDNIDAGFNCIDCNCKHYHTHSQKDFKRHLRYKKDFEIHIKYEEGKIPHDIFLKHLQLECEIPVRPHR